MKAFENLKYYLQYHPHGWIQNYIQKLPLAAASLIIPYFLADTASIWFSGLIPNAPVATTPLIQPISKEKRTPKSIVHFDAVTSRNIFNSKNLSPEEETDTDIGIKSDLPFQLLGTVILEDDLSSVATMIEKTQNKVFPARIGDTIEEKIKILGIANRKVWFVNLKTQNTEFLEIEENSNGSSFARNTGISGAGL